MRYLGIDVGGTNIKYGVFNEQGIEDISQSGEIRTITNDLEKFLSSIDSIVDKFDSIDGIGLSVPCAVNSKTGVVVESGGVPVLNGLNIKEILSNRLGIKVAVENDANCCALAEKWIGNGKDIENFICVTIGTGIGGGIIINNKLLSGNRSFAGEFGKMLFDIHETDIKNCKCASYYGSTSSLIIECAKVLNISKKGLNGKLIFEMIEKENKEVIEVYNNWIRRLSIIIVNLGFIFDPDKILIGGGVSATGRIIEDIRRQIKRIDDYGLDWEINNCKYFNNSGKIGAIYNYIMENSKQNIL